MERSSFGLIVTVARLSAHAEIPNDPLKKFKVLVVVNNFEQWHNVQAEKFIVDEAGNLEFDPDGADPAIYAAGRWICASVVTE